MPDLRFLQWCRWRSTSSGMLHRYCVTTQSTCIFMADAPRTVLRRPVLGFPSALFVSPYWNDAECTQSAAHLLQCKPVSQTNATYYWNRWHGWESYFSTTPTSCNSWSFAFSGNFNSFQFITFLFYNFSNRFKFCYLVCYSSKRCIPFFAMLSLHDFSFEFLFFFYTSRLFRSFSAFSDNWYCS
jgi:hypothetical protein